MSDYICKKCGCECEIDYETAGHNYFPMAWCDECGGYAKGFDGVALDLQADKLAELADRAHDREKDKDI